MESVTDTNEATTQQQEPIVSVPERLMFAGCNDHRCNLGLSCSKIRWRETGIPVTTENIWQLICDLGNALRDVHDFCEPSTHHRYVNVSLSAMQRASALLKEIGM